MTQQEGNSGPGGSGRSGRDSHPAARPSRPFRTGQKLLSVLGLLAVAGGLFGAGLGLGIWFSVKPELAQKQALTAKQTAKTAPLDITVVDRDSPPALPAPSFQPPTAPAQASQIALPPASTAPAALTANPTPPSTTAQIPAEAWLRNAVKMPIADDNRPLIAIVIDDMGVARRRSQRAVALPAPLTMAFLPYAGDVAAQATAAQAAGHELLVHIPMQPLGFNSDPGPNVLDARLGPEEVNRRLLWNLSQFTGYIGFNNHMGSQFTANQEAMAAIMAVARARGLLFLDSRTSSQSVGFETARDLGVTATIRDVFLDNTDSVHEVEMRLRQTMAQARARGSAIAIGHPRDSTITVLEKWLPEIAAQGFRLAPLSAVVLKRKALHRQQAKVSTHQ